MGARSATKPWRRQCRCRPGFAAEPQQRGQPRERSYLVESALPPPDQRADIPLPADFDFETDLELQQQQNQKSAGQRFRFKH